MNVIFLDNNKNWRSGKDGHDQLQRSKSWSRTTNNDKDDGLPEWCIDDSTEDNMPGSFDASGQFRLFKVKYRFLECQGLFLFYGSIDLRTYKFLQILGR